MQQRIDFSLAGWWRRAVLYSGLAVAAGLCHGADYEHQVIPGDTVISISQRWLAVPRDYIKVQQRNRLSDTQARALKPGSIVRIPEELLRREAVGAQVTAVGGDVKVSQGGQTAALLAGQPLAANSSIVTGADGSVAIQLADGTVLRIPSKSEVRLEAMNQVVTGPAYESRWSVMRGRIEAVVAKVVSPGRFSISTPTAAMGVRGTAFRASFDPEQRVARGEVLEGQVAVDGAALSSSKTRPPAVVLDAGMGSVTDQSGVPSAPRALLPAPAFALASADLQERPVVRFPLQVLPGAKAYRAQIGSGSTLDTVLREEVFIGAEVKFGDLPDGAYTLALRAIDEVGLEGKSLLQSFRLKARPEPPITQLPAPNGKARGESAQFAWGESTEGHSYRFQLARDAGFKDIVQEEKSFKTAALTSAALPPGAYFWRVGSIRPDGDTGPWGDSQRFAMLPPTAPPQASVANGMMQFAWSGEPGQKFLAQIARDREFGALIHSIETVQTQISIKQPPAGVYYIRLRATDVDGFVGPFSAAQRFEVINRLSTGDSANVSTSDGKPVQLY